MDQLIGPGPLDMNHGPPSNRHRLSPAGECVRVHIDFLLQIPKRCDPLDDDASLISLFKCIISDIMDHLSYVSYVSVTVTS